MKKRNRHKGLALLTGEMPLAMRERIEILRVGEERQLVVNGVVRILQYGSEEMILALGKERLIIQGVDLDCMTYVSGAIGVRGIVTQLIFTRGQK